MKRHLIYIVILFCLAIVCSCHRRYQYPSVLQEADSLCVANPDSAFLLLDSLHYRQPMTKKELARYALLLAKATDKTYQSLIPCDSLLNFALDYYKEPTADRATALLYKGCLEDEVNHDEDAIKHLQEARLILQNYPEEVSTRRITLGLLGDLYYQHKYFKDCLPVYQEALELCETDVDKSYTYRDIGSYYTLTEQRDSALYYHHKAVKYALASKDSSIVSNAFHTLALAYNVFNENDSASFFTKKAVETVPHNNPRGRYLHTLGLLLYQDSAKTDAILPVLQEAASDTTYTYRQRINKLLAQIEEERGHFYSSLGYYHQYTDYIDSLYTAERSVDVQQLVYEYNTRLQVKSEQIKSSKRISIIILVSSLIVLFALSIAVLIFFRKRKQQFKNQLRIRELKSKLTTYQELINDTLSTIHPEDNESFDGREIGKYRSKMIQLITANKDIISQLKAELSEAHEDNAKLLKLLKEKEEKENNVRIDEELRQCGIALLRTEVVKEIINLAEGLKSEDSLPILPLAKQKLLREEVKTVYSSYISRLNEDYPNLKEDYLIYLCLERAGLTIPAIGICFAHSNVNAVYKMRKRIKLHINK